VRELASKNAFLVFLTAVSLALIVGIAVSGLLTTSRTLRSTGTVKAINVEVYWDAACTQTIDSIDWGFAEPGDNIVKTVYVKNTGTAPMTLSMSYSDWDPVATGNYLSLSWNRESTSLGLGEVIDSTITLTVSPDISGITAYSFNIVIEGTG
jgi:hypothetical protein